MRPARPEDFTTERRRFVGGSDIAAILGVSKRRTAFDVWAEKTNQLAPRGPDDDSDEAAAGRFLEPFIRDRFERKTGLTLYRRPLVIERGIFGAHPDDLASQSPGSDPFAIFEAKTRSPFQRGLWGDEGSDAVPDDEMCQVQWYMHWTGFSVAYIAALFDRALSIFRVARDTEFGHIAEAAAKKFWKDYVETGQPPGLRGIHVDEYVRRKFPHVLGPAREPTNEEKELVREALDYAATEKAARAAKEETRAKLKLLIATAEGLKDNALTVYYRERAGKKTVDYKSVLTELRNDIAIQIGPRWPRKAATLIASVDASLARFTTVGAPYRELRIYTGKGADE